MSDLITDSQIWIPTAVVAASLLGSGHCVGMCGGLVLACARTKRDWVAFQLGRLSGYLALGALAGTLGSYFFSENRETTTWIDRLSWVAALGLSWAFVIMGVRIWRGRPIHFAVVPKSILSFWYNKYARRPAFAGLLTSLLPCGWLHSFVLGAVAARSIWGGAGFLFAFWLGTLPALSLSPWLVRRVARPLVHRSPRLAALLLIGIGLLSLGSRIRPMITEASPPHSLSEVRKCH